MTTTPLIRAVLAGLGLMLGAQTGAAQEVGRCGWYANPTPGNHWLTDRDSTWVLSTQGGPEVPGWLDLPEEAFASSSAATWVETNGSYGYGCACITGEFGAVETGQVLRIAKMSPLPLARCEADPALPAAEG